MKKLIACLLVAVVVIALCASIFFNANNNSTSSTAPQSAPMTIQDIAELIEHKELLDTITKMDNEGVPAYAREFLESDDFKELNNAESLYVADSIYHFMISSIFVENAGSYSVHLAAACDWLLQYNQNTPDVFSKMQDLFYDAFSTAIENGAETRYLAPFTRVPEARILMQFYSTDHGEYVITDRHDFSVFDNQQMHRLVNAITQNPSFDYDAELYMVLASRFDDYVHKQAMYKLRKMTQANMAEMNLAQNRLLCAVRENKWLFSNNSNSNTPMTEEELQELRHNIMNNFSIDLAEKLTHFCCYAPTPVADYGYECAMKVATAAGKLREDSEMRTIMQNAIQEVVKHKNFNDWDKIWALLYASDLIS